MKEPGAGCLETGELLSRARAGDDTAFEELVRQLQGRVRAFCFSILGDSNLAEDVAQDVFLRAYQSLHSLREDGAFVGWLLRLARNRCIDVIRAERRDGALLVPNIEVLCGDALPGGQQSPRLDSLDLIQKLFSSLSESQREILFLREVHGYSYEELGAILGLTLDGVKGQLRRARAGCEKALLHQSDGHLSGEVDVQRVASERMSKKR